MIQWLHRVGTARRAGARCAVVFDGLRCPGCEGRCGVSVGGGEVPLDFDVPEGTPVVVAASAHGLARRAAGVFGWPVGAVVVAAALAEWYMVSEALIAATLLGTFLAAVGVRAVVARPDGVSRPRDAADEVVRVVLE